MSFAVIQITDLTFIHSYYIAFIVYTEPLHP